MHTPDAIRPLEAAQGIAPILVDTCIHDTPRRPRPDRWSDVGKRSRGGHQDVANGAPSAADTREIDPDYPLPAGCADGPSAITLEVDAMLRHQDSPAAARALAHGRPMRRQRGRGAWHTERDCVAQRAAVACRLEPQGVGIGKAVAPIELERDLVKGSPVMHGATSAATGR